MQPGGGRERLLLVRFDFNRARFITHLFSLQLRFTLNRRRGTFDNTQTPVSQKAQPWAFAAHANLVFVAASRSRGLDQRLSEPVAAAVRRAAGPVLGHENRARGVVPASASPSGVDDGVVKGLENRRLAKSLQNAPRRV